jgi:hypothetical protein
MRRVIACLHRLVLRSLNELNLDPLISFIESLMRCRPQSHTPMHRLSADARMFSWPVACDSNL